MAKRFKDALLIQEGACNPSGICGSIREAQREILDEKHPDGRGKGMDDVRTCPAVRLMVHQLAFLTNAFEAESNFDVYHKLGNECRALAEASKE
jgi:hypothetical protein